MNATGVTTLHRTIQETIVWLKAVEEELQLDNRQQAYKALRAVLHARVPPEVAIKLGAQLPILVRGVYYENWHAAGTPTKERHAQDFADHVGAELSPQFPRGSPDRCPGRVRGSRFSGRSSIPVRSKS